MMSGMIAFLANDSPFPPVERADDSGLLAVGADLSPERLLSAYSQGIFPWYEEPPVLWYAPPERFVLYLSDFHAPASLKKFLRKNPYEIQIDCNFRAVVENCAAVRQGNTWIGPEMIGAYEKLFEAGYAHSVESYFEGQLCGGIYGVSVGKIFCAESMFYLRDHASKIALLGLVSRLQQGGYQLVDCQVYTDNMARYGAKTISRQQYMQLLSRLKEIPGSPPGF